MWIPPLISSSIILYVAATVVFAMNYWLWDPLMNTISIVMVVLGSLLLAGHYYFKYGGKGNDSKH